MELIDWQNCYDDNWNGLITDDSFQHPAKMARGLLQRIISFGFERGYWKKGDCVGDPFGGVGTTGIVGATNGLKVVSVELEPRFFELAKKNYALHQSIWQACGDPQPVILNGDSRKFAELVGQAVGVVTSPPYAESMTQGNKPEGYDYTRYGGGGQLANGQTYGTSTGQVGALKEGNIAAVLTSPPYAESVKGAHGETETAAESQALRVTPGGSLGASQRHGGYGVTDGQVGALKEGVLEGVVTSPPYESSLVSHEDATANMQKRLLAKGIQRKDSGILRQREGGCMSGYQTYTETKDSIAGLAGETYWCAMAVIYRQCFEAIRPNGVLCCVIKDYVKNKARVPLCEQTCVLLEAVGFRVETRVRALLVKESVEADLFGADVTKRKERKSFFRRLAEKKGSPRIDWEEVLIARRLP